MFNKKMCGGGGGVRKYLSITLPRREATDVVSFSKGGVNL